MLDFTFPKKNVPNQKRVGWAEREVVIKRGK